MYTGTAALRNQTNDDHHPRLQEEEEEEEEDEEDEGRFCGIVAASRFADRLLEVADVDPSSLAAPPPVDDPGGWTKKFKQLHGCSLDEKLLELHVEESLKVEGQQRQQQKRSVDGLLTLLCRRERCNRLVVDLLPPDEGFVISASTRDGITRELARLSYREDAFLSHLDNQELPAFLVDLLEAALPDGDLFYAGSVVAEVRAAGGGVRHVLLRPTTRTLICDSNVMAAEARLNPEERLSLEARLAMASEPQLCLDPDPAVSMVARKSAFSRQMFSFRRRRFEASRKRKLDAQISAQPPADLKLIEFIGNRGRPKPSSSKVPSSKLLLADDDDDDRHAPPSKTDVMLHARAIQRRPEVNDNTPHVVEEYILETAEREAATRIYHTRLTIFQRLSDDEYLGELYVERDFKEGEPRKGSTCRFVLGTRPHALRYIDQFTEIFTEEGRKSVKITHQVPNQPPRVTMTPGMRERMQQQQKQAQQVQKQQPSILQQTLQQKSNMADAAAEQEEISAIMESLIKDAEQFDKPKVTMPQLAAQLQQPPAVSLPSYSQAIAQTRPRSRQDAPGLQALLANTPSAEVVNGGCSSPAAGAAPAISATASSAAVADSTNEITLAALLAKPPPPSKVVSPLLQQLQQPVPPPKPQPVQIARPPIVANGGGNASNGNVVSLQNLLQQSTAPLQLSIPGLSVPVTLNLPSSTSSVGQKTLNVSTLHGIRLPQQPVSSAAASILKANQVVKPNHLLQVRQAGSGGGGQPVYVQLPTSTSQSIQIVRSVPQQPQQILMNLKSPPCAAAPSPMMPSPQTAAAVASPSAPGSVGTIPASHGATNAIMSPPTPQHMIGHPHHQPANEPLLAIQIPAVVTANNSIEHSPHHGLQLLSAAHGGGTVAGTAAVSSAAAGIPNNVHLHHNAPVVHHAAAAAAAAQIKMRQQRKQSLK